MKTSVLASMLFGTLAVAAPFERRAKLTKTEVITTTVFSTVTVYDDEPAPTSSLAVFYEQPKPSSAAPVVYSSAAAPAAPVSTPAKAPVASPSPVIVASAPAPPAPAVTSSAPPPPPPAPVVTPTSAAAPPPAQPTYGSSPATGGNTYTDVDMTVYDGYGGKGACGTTLDDSQPFVALSKGIFGDATYDRMTGDATNVWCKATIKVEYNGKSVICPVVDRCAGCAGTNDVDLSRAAWAALGLTEGTRLKASWSKVS